MSESVMVVNNRLISPIINIKNNGCLITGNDQIFDNIIENHSFMPRSEAEYNFDFKQVIPYVIIRNANEYLLLKEPANRLKKGFIINIHSESGDISIRLPVYQRKILLLTDYIKNLVKKSCWMILVNYGS